MIKKTIFTLLIFFNIFSIEGTAQNIKLAGRIVEQGKNKPLSFVTIEVKSLAIGTYTDTDGYFTISIPKKNQNDAIDFYALGYEKKKMIINNLLKSENQIIKLKQKFFNIKEVKVKPKKTKVIKLGVKQKKPWRYQITNVFGAQYGHYIRNKDNLSGFVKSVSFYIAGVGHTDTPFRIRVYKHDKNKNCPGEDILNKNLIVQNKNGEGWYTVDVSDYYIRFPKNGMHVMMEWVYTDDKYYYLKKLVRKDNPETLKPRKFYGQSIGNVMKQKEICFWHTGLGNKWTKVDAEYKGYINVMINAEIEAEK